MANFGYFWPDFLLKITLFHPAYPNKPHGPPKMISLIQLLNGGPKEGSWTLKSPSSTFLLIFSYKRGKKLPKLAIFPLKYKCLKTNF